MRWSRATQSPVLRDTVSKSSEEYQLLFGILAHCKKSAPGLSTELFCAVKTVLQFKMESNQGLTVLPEKHLVQATQLAGSTIRKLRRASTISIESLVLLILALRLNAGHLPRANRPQLRTGLFSTDERDTLGAAIDEVEASIGRCTLEWRASQAVEKAPLNFKPIQLSLENAWHLRTPVNFRPLVDGTQSNKFEMRFPRSKYGEIPEQVNSTLKLSRGSRPSYDMPERRPVEGFIWNGCYVSVAWFSERDKYWRDSSCVSFALGTGIERNPTSGDSLQLSDKGLLNIRCLTSGMVSLGLEAQWMYGRGTQLVEYGVEDPSGLVVLSIYHDFKDHKRDTPKRHLELVRFQMTVSGEYNFYARVNGKIAQEIPLVVMPPSVVACE